MILSSRVARHMSLAGMQYWIAGAESARRDDYLTRAKCATNTGVRARYVRLARAAHHAYLRAMRTALECEERMSGAARAEE